VTAHVPAPGTYQLSGPDGTGGSQAVVVQDNIVFMTQTTPSGTTQTNLTVDRKGLHLADVYTSALTCTPQTGPLVIPSRLWEGESWNASYPCYAATADNPFDVTFSVHARVVTQAVLSVAAEPVPVVTIIYTTTERNQWNQVIEEIIDTDSLDPRSGLVIQEMIKSSGNMGYLSVTWKFERPPEAEGGSFG
jgi:hypothetical protein